MRGLATTSLLVLTAAVLATLPMSATAQEGLSRTEKKIAAHVSSNADEAIALLERITNINSGTMNIAGNKQVADVIAAELRPLGFETRWVPLPESTRRSGHLVAERKGKKGRRLLLIGHLDTVFEESSPFQRFERISDSVAAGPGVSDMKGGDVVIVQAMKALHAAGALDGTRITIVMTGDEESPGNPLSVAREALIEAGKRSDVALGFEGGSRGLEFDQAVIARRSSSRWLLRVMGNPAHSSGVFSTGAGAGAIFETARILDAFYETLRDEHGLTFNPGAILGGSDIEYDQQTTSGTASGKTNIVAATALVHGDIRTVSEEQLLRVRERMRAIVAQNLPRTSAEIEFSDGYPAMAVTPGSEALLAQLDESSRDLGLGPVRAFDPTRRGAADISFVAPYVKAGLDGLGVHGRGSHTVDEQVNLPSLTTQAQRAAVLIYRLTR